LSILNVVCFDIIFHRSIFSYKFNIFKLTHIKSIFHWKKRQTLTKSLAILDNRYLYLNKGEEPLN